MDFLRSKLPNFGGLFTRQAKVERPREITRFEGYFELCYKVLSWDDPSLTLTAFLAINFVFWLVVQLQLRIFGIIFLIVTVGFIADCCFENSSHLGDSLHLEVLDELRNDFNDVVLSLKALRKDSPSSFCIGMSVIFLFISFIAKNVSGYIIFYVTLLGIFFIPLGISKLPPHYLASLKQFIQAVGTEKGVLAEEELIPFISAKDFSQRDPDLESLLTDRTVDSVTNSLISGLSSMPSHLDVLDKDLEEDLLPSGLAQNAVSFTPGDTSSDSDSDNRAMSFESGHFKGDSSSEEEVYAKNLTFSNEDKRDSAERDATSSFLSVDNIMKVASMVRNAVNPLQRKESSSESDFEMISPEEADGQ